MGHIEHTLFPTNLINGCFHSYAYSHGSHVQQKGPVLKSKWEQESEQKVTSNHPLGCTETANIQKKKLICFDLCQYSY